VWHHIAGVKLRHSLNHTLCHLRRDNIFAASVDVRKGQQLSRIRLSASETSVEYRQTYSVSQLPHLHGFLNFFPNGWEFLINLLHTYCTIISTLDYKFLLKYLQFWQSYAILSTTTSFSEFLHFTRTFTSKFAYWANDVIVDVMSYATCLLTL